jgi:16S rRNA pseudouridine516 synthase
MDLIKSGNVKINGKRRRSNRDVVIARDTIEVCLDGEWQILEHEIERTILLMYKPRGYLCTHKDNHERPKIYDLVDEEYKQLRSAGRLDQNSEGLLVLTDDGYYLFGLTSPKLPCKKTYIVGLLQPLSGKMMSEALSGRFIIEINGKTHVLLPVEISELRSGIAHEFHFLDLDKNLYWYQFVLMEGKYNQIRKMCEKYDNPVQRLIRIQHGEHRLNKKIFDNTWVVVSRRGK